MSRLVICGVSFLAFGCAAIAPSLQGNASVFLRPQIVSGYFTQATVSVYGSSSIDHLTLKLFQGSAELAAKTITQAQLNQPIAFSNLRANTPYRIKAFAYLADNTLISHDDASSWRDFTTGTDDRPGILSLPVHLVDRLFTGQGTASIQVTGGGYLPGAPEEAKHFFRLMTSVAGNGTAGYIPAHEGVGATSASLYGPYDIALDGAGNVYIADFINSRIRKVSPTGVIITVAGNGVNACSGDNGPATSASIFRPSGVAVDSAGNLYISESSHRIRKVSNGVITTVAGNGSATCSGDGGPATLAALNNPLGMRFDAYGNLYIADWSNHRVRKITPAGIITTVAGNGTIAYNPAHEGGPATSATLNAPADVDLDAAGNLYVSERNGQRVRKITPDGKIFTIAGNGVNAFGGDGGPATSASLYWPWGLAVDPWGNVFVADEGNQRIRWISPNGFITTVVGNGEIDYDPAHEGVSAISAALHSPVGLTRDAQGNLYVANYGQHRIRKIHWGTPAD